jgi:hypothetical protein
LRGVRHRRNAFCCGTAHRRRGQTLNSCNRRSPARPTTSRFPAPLEGGGPRLPTPRPGVYRGLPAPSTRLPLACTPTCILTCIPAFNPLPRLSPRIPRLRRRRALSLGRDPAARTHRVAGAPEHPALDGPRH